MKYAIDQHKLSRFGSLEFLARQVVEGFITGLHKSPFHGFSVEFAEHRLYNRGESIRHIDWKLYGRSEKLFVKRFEEETNLRCLIVIDQSSSMYFPMKDDADINNPSKLLFSVYSAASLMELVRRQRDAAGLALFADQLNLITKCRSSSTHHKHLFQQLEGLIDPEKGKMFNRTAAALALHQIAELQHKRSLVVIFSDMMDDPEQADEMFPALRHLRYNKHEVVLFHVTDQQKEEDLAYENRPYRFIDLETKESIKLNPVEIQGAYKKAVEARKTELKLRCGQYRIDYVEADINKGFDQVLMAYMIKRVKLF
jgi:uncharacterized protein (DUF58 family)